MMDKDEEALYEKRRKREQALYSRKDRFVRFLYDKEKQTYCARTPCGWFKIFTYYILFLLVFGAIWLFLCWYSVDGTDVEEVKKYRASLEVDAYPGTTFLGAHIDGYRDSIIWYTTSGNVDYTANRGHGIYVSRITKMFQDQNKACGGDECAFKKSAFGFCSEMDYGYTNRTPCIFVRLGSIDKWKPKGFKETPSRLPDELKSRMNNSRDCLWISCSGVRAYDKDHLGRFTYYPEGAYHEDYFPQKGDVTPIIALHLKEVQRKTTIRLQCELFADNLTKKPYKIADTILYVE